MSTRLNKYLASCGLGSRRNVEVLISSGRVAINGLLVRDFGRTVQEGDQVTVDGQLIQPQELVYMALHKPRGYLCAVTDENYPVVLDLLPRRYDLLRLFPIGRLDLQSEGLLLLTNDGDFAQRLIHPSQGITKEYEVRMNRPLNSSDFAALRKGATLEGRRIQPKSVMPLRRRPYDHWATFTLAEGLKREIRVIAEAHGLSVEVLFRRAIGKLRLENLKVGEAVELSRERLWDWVTKGGVV